MSYISSIQIGDRVLRIAGAKCKHKALAQLIRYTKFMQCHGINTENWVGVIRLFSLGDEMQVSTDVDQHHYVNIHALIRPKLEE